MEEHGGEGRVKESLPDASLTASGGCFFTPVLKPRDHSRSVWSLFSNVFIREVRMIIIQHAAWPFRI